MSTSETSGHDAGQETRLDRFDAYRARMNRRILDDGTHLGIKRFFNLDGAAYRDGALDSRTKELLGLVVGGSIVIPHLRHAIETVDLLRARST